MQRARIGVIAAAVLAVATVAFAQKPDFSGTWAPEPPAGGAAAGGAAGTGGGGGGMRGGGGPMTVKQTADTLTIERSMGGNTMTSSYKLDGSESKNPGRGGAEMVSTAKWDGDKLVITTKTDQGDQTQTWSMEGGNLVIERTGGRGPSKTTYKKTT
jgi:hypothetical protein